MQKAKGTMYDSNRPAVTPRPLLLSTGVVACRERIIFRDHNLLDEIGFNRVYHFTDQHVDLQQGTNKGKKTKA